MESQLSGRQTLHGSLTSGSSLSLTEALGDFSVVCCQLSAPGRSYDGFPSFSAQREGKWPPEKVFPSLIFTSFFVQGCGEEAGHGDL